MIESGRNYWTLFLFLIFGGLAAAETPNGRLELHPDDPLPVQRRILRRTYPVQGRTIDEVIARVNAANPNRLGKAGETQWQYEYSAAGFEFFSQRTRTGRYEVTAVVTSAAVSATITVTLPSWENAGAAPPQDQRIWSILLAQLEEHEQGHASDFSQGAEEIQRAILGTVGRATAETLSEAVRRAITEGNRAALENAARIALGVQQASARRDVYEQQEWTLARTLHN